MCNELCQRFILRGSALALWQWTNKRKEDEKVRKALKLSESERIAVVIGAGYYDNESTIPCSSRKPMTEIFNTI